MERDILYIRGEGLVDVGIDRTKGEAVNDSGDRYQKVGETISGTEKERWVRVNAGEERPQIKSENRGFTVDYGVKEDDPFKDLIHTFRTFERMVYQYQINPSTGYIGLYKVADPKETDMIAPASSRSFVNRRYRSRRV